MSHRHRVARPRLLGAVTLAAVLAVPGVALTASAASAGAGEVYVALGDSFTSGPGIPNPKGEPRGCVRSDHNYPTLVADAITPAEFRDVSCGGAVSDHMTQPQQTADGPNPPQFDALTGDTTLVTVSVGGNDIGFGEIVTTCATLSVTDPFGAPCKERYTSGGSDELAERVAAYAPKMRAVVKAIGERSPHATVLVVGYLRVLPPSEGCYPREPIAKGDVPYLDRIQRLLNRALADAASAHGAGYVDAYGPSLGHDICQLPGDKWVEGTVPTSPAAPVHPNAAGMEAVAKEVLAALR
ncbi:MAG: SGNH/GDSL hydrolase family protein [Micromonosporaceae bacterium]|nr:SGNH/GDSL hydrolase family protein [Micromonosporaceae bacterium]